VARCCGFKIQLREKFMRQLWRALVLVAMAAMVCSAQTKEENPKATAPAKKHFTTTVADAKWEAPPAEAMSGTPSVEGGGTLRFAVVEGNPEKAGAPFTVMLNCSDGFKVAPHWHPTDENIVLLKGSVAVGTGDKFDPAAAKEIPTGGYGFMPAHMHHFAVCKGDTDILVYGSGPFKINWISAASAGAPAKPAAGAKKEAAPEKK
jgi:hypothetical protein